MTDTKSRWDIEKEAKQVFEQRTPKPTPPELSKRLPPAVIQIGNNAHLWIDVSEKGSGYRSVGTATATVFMIERTHDKDQRIQGDLSLDDLIALGEQVARAIQDMQTTQHHIEKSGQYDESLRDWERKCEEFARKQVAEWEKAQKK